MPKYHGISAAESQQEPDILNRWNHNFDMLQPAVKQPKKAKKHAVKVMSDYDDDDGNNESEAGSEDFATEEDEVESYEVAPTLMYKKPKTKYHFTPTAQPAHYHRRPSQTPRVTPPPKYEIPEYVQRDSERQTQDISSYSHFKPPRLLKITEHDIRMKVPQPPPPPPPLAPMKKLKPIPTWAAYREMAAAGGQNKFKSAFEWPAEQMVEMDMMDYGRHSSPRPPMTMMDDDDEFLPFKNNVPLMMMQQQQQHEQPAMSFTSDGSQQSDEYSNLYGGGLAPVQQYQSFTQRKNKKNVMSSLNTRITNK